MVTLFRLTSAVILVQIALGGLVTFGFITPLPHMIIGFVVVVVALVTVAITLRAKPVDRQLQGVCIAIIVGLAAQVALGFTTLALDNVAVAWVHFVLGVLIYAMALTGMSFAQRQEHMAAGRREGASVS